MRRILSLDIPQFYFSAMQEALERPHSVVLIRDGIVMDGSPDVFERGIVRGMTERQALRVAAVRAVEVDRAKAREQFGVVWDILAAHTPLVETTDQRSGYLDLTGCLRADEWLWQRVERIAAELKSATGLTPKLGCGTSKFNADLSRRLERVFKGLRDEANAVHKARIREIPGVAPALVERCNSLGLLNLADIAALSLNDFLSIASTPDAWRLYQCAINKDPLAVVTNYPVASIERAKHFELPTDSEPEVRAAFSALRESCEAELSSIARAVGVLVVELQFGEGVIQIEKSRFGKGFISPMARQFRMERVFEEMWKGKELSRIVLKYDEIHHPQSEQERLWDESGAKRLAQLEPSIGSLRAKHHQQALGFCNSPVFPQTLPRFAIRVSDETMTEMCG